MLSLLIALAAPKAHGQSELLSQMAGHWQFMASNNGKEVAPGVYSSSVDTVTFRATLAADNQSLQCHTDCLYKSVTGLEYPADWTLLVEENSEGKHRVGWKLTAESPLSEKEFLEPASSYLENGFFYWGSSEEQTHRYLYMLAENSDMTGYVAPTFWSDWSSPETTQYAIADKDTPAYKLYLLVSSTVPFGKTVGFVEIWASPQLKRNTADPSGISNITADRPTDGAYYDLWGRRLSERPHKGIYLQNGRKYVAQ